MLARSALAATLLSLLVACSGAGSDDEEVADDSALSDTGPGLGELAAGATLATTANVNLRSESRIANNVLRVVPRGTRVAARGGAAENGFYAVTVDGASGFISAKYLARVNAAGADGGATASGFRVTYIGDSHSDFEGSGGSFGVLGYRVSQHLAAEGVPLALFAASSSAPNWWFDDTSDQAATWGYTQTVSSPARRTCTRGSKTGTCVPKLSDILAERPSLFVIEQGTNLLGRGSADITNQVRKMIQAIDGKVDRCLWVSAPRASTSQYAPSEIEDVYRIISANASPRCTVYDSRFLPRTDASGTPVLDAEGKLVIDVPLAYDGSDGVHFRAEPARRWGDGVAMMIDWMRTHP